MRTTLAYAAKLALITTLCGLWLFATTAQTYACVCAEDPGSPSEALAKSTVVFAGRVIAKRDLDTADSRTVEFKVSTAWKGSVQETMYVLAIAHGTSCYFQFTEGEEYVVYSRSDGTTPKVSLCDRTMRASSDDFDALGEGWVPEPGSSAPYPYEGIGQPALPATGGCNILSQSAHAPMDTWALGLIAGVAWLGLRRRPRK